MGKLRDRWNDRGEPAATDMLELDRLAGRLDDWREMHRMGCKAVEAAERDEAEGEAITADEFKGAVAFDEAERQRAKLTAAAVAARRERDRLAKLVQVGEDLCNRQAEEIAESHVATADRERVRVQAELDEAHQLVAAKQAALALIEETRAWWRDLGLTKLRAKFSPSAQSALRLREMRDMQGRPIETHEEQYARSVEETLAVRTRDDDSGEIVPAYSKLPSDGSAVRIG
jgi:hypothetical protein